MTKVMHDKTPFKILFFFPLPFLQFLRGVVIFYQLMYYVAFLHTV